MDLRRPRPGEWLAGAAGAALVASLFLPWYEGARARSSVSGWEAFAAVDVILAVAGLLGALLLVISTMHRTPAAPIAAAALCVPVATVALALAAIRLAEPPNLAGEGPAVVRKAGPYAGLVAALLLFGGSALAMWSVRPSRMQRPPRVRRMPAPQAGGSEPGPSVP